MAEESMLSTAESGIEPPPGAAAGPGAQAEMITKKLANYWCLIGSIPLVMFLLVAIPTIFYVKKFSEYVNAEYCDSKSCKDLADAILKAGPAATACTKFSSHVCAAKVDFTMLAMKKLFDEMKMELPEGGQPPPGVSEAGKARAYMAACTAGEFPEDQDPFYLAALGNERIDRNGRQEPAAVSGVLSAYGIDGLVRAVAFLGNNSGNQEEKASLELSAPIHDFYARMLMAVSEKGYKEVMDFMSVSDPDDFPATLIDTARKTLDAFILSTAKTTKQTWPKLMSITELKALAGDKFKWEVYIKQINDASQDAFPDDTEVRLVHPQYLLGLDKFIEENLQKVPDFVIHLNVLVQLEACIFTYGRLTLKGFTKDKEQYCVLHTERMFHGVIGQNSFYKRATQFGAPTGINPGGSNSSAMAIFLDKEVHDMLDSMSFSYSLSTSATEENRIAFYHKTLNVSVAPGFFNNTDGLTDAETKVLTERAVASDDGADFIAMSNQILSSFKDAYWAGMKNKTPTFLKFRNRYHPVYATFTPTEDHLYVPFGVFTPPIFRNSQKNRIFYGVAGYLVMTGMMKAISLTDAMVVKNQLQPENWIGYSWTRKVERFAECIGRPTNDTMDVFTDPYMVGAVTPALRFYRRKIFEKAYPRPEFRIDWVSELSSTQVFFYSWAMLHCGTKQGQELIDIATKNNFYFLDSFKCEPQLKAYEAKPCDLWNTTRRDY